MSNITKKFEKGLPKPSYGYGFGLSSISNWENSFFGGYYRTLSDYPEIKISDNVEFDSASLNLPWHLKDKLLKMFLSKVKTNNYQDELLRNAKTEKVELYFQGVCIKTTLHPKSKADVIDKLILLSTEKEFSPMFSHYRKFILESDVYFLTPAKEQKSKGGGKGDDQETKEENEEKSDSGKEKKDEKPEEKKSESKSKGSGKEKKSDEDKSDEDKSDSEKSEEKNKSEEPKDKSEEKKSEGGGSGEKEKPKEGKDKNESSGNTNTGESEEGEDEDQEAKDKEQEAKDKKTQEEEKAREEKRKAEALKISKEEIEKNIKNFIDAIKDIIEREPHKFLSDLSGFNKNIRVKIEGPIRSANPFNNEHIRNAETLVKMLDISFDNANDIVKNLRIGKLDISKIAEVPAGNISVYKQEVENQITRPFSVAILCDESGSMSGSRIHSQLDIVKSLYLAFSDLLPQDKIFVYGHSGSSSPELFVYHDPHNQNFIKTIDNMLDHSHSQNYDGPIIEEVYKTIRGMTNDKIIFIVLSDGAPSGYSYGSYKDIQKMKQIVEKCKRDEFVTVGVGIQTMAQKNLYHYSIVVNDLSEMAKKVSHIVNHTVKSEFQ